MLGVLALGTDETTFVSGAPALAGTTPAAIVTIATADTTSVGRNREPRRIPCSSPRETEPGRKSARQGSASIDAESGEVDRTPAVGPTPSATRRRGSRSVSQPVTRSFGWGRRHSGTPTAPTR